MSSPHVFSHFRQHFIAETAWPKDINSGEQLQQAAAGGSKDSRRDPVVKMAGLGRPRGERAQQVMSAFLQATHKTEHSIACGQDKAPAGFVMACYLCSSLSTCSAVLS
jgi:hypothetical protein